MITQNRLQKQVGIENGWVDNTDSVQLTDASAQYSLVRAVSYWHICCFLQVFQQELPESIQDTWDHLTEDLDTVPESRWRYASPKFLLDNLCYTMHCLFNECFSSTEIPQDCEYDKE